MILLVELDVGMAFFTFDLSSLDKAAGADGMLNGYRMSAASRSRCRFKSEGIGEKESGTPHRHER